MSTHFAALPHALSSESPSLFAMWPSLGWPFAPLSRMDSAMRMAKVPSFVSPSSTSFAPAVSAISKSNTRSVSGRSCTASVCTLVSGTVPSGATHFWLARTTPVLPDFTSTILSCSIFPMGCFGFLVPCEVSSLQKSTPFTSPCENHSDRWCGWSCSSPGASSIGHARVIFAPPGPMSG